MDNKKKLFIYYIEMIQGKFPKLSFKIKVNEMYFVF